MEIIKEETYRSKPLVNMTADMVRVTLTCSRNEWRQAKKTWQDQPQIDRLKAELKIHQNACRYLARKLNKLLQERRELRAERDALKARLDALREGVERIGGMFPLPEEVDSYNEYGPVRFDYVKAYTRMVTAIRALCGKEAHNA